MLFKKFTLLLGALVLLSSQSLSAQSDNGLITGKVHDPDGNPVAFANVVLKLAKDSSLFKVEYSKEDGGFAILQIPAGAYWVDISYVGLPPYQSEVINLTDGQKLNLGQIDLNPGATELSEVVVKAQKPLLEIRPDRMVLNVEGSINATGNNAMDLLRKSPGVVIDNNDNISMLGRTGVQIYIDGKPSPLSSADLASFLKTIQSTEIEAIEIITNPSSRYDAESTAGIINIKMKKDKRLGANANLNLGGSMGEVGQYNGSINGNFRNKNLNTFGSFGYYDGENRNYMGIYREQSGLVFDQDGLNASDWSGQNFRLGTDFFLSKTQTIGFLVNGNLNDNGNQNNSRTLIGRLGESSVDSVLIAENMQSGTRDNLNFNLNYKIDNGKGSSWNFDADYGLFRNEGNSFQPNFYKDATETEILNERIFSTFTPTDIDIYTFKLDHERPMWGGKAEVGTKISLVQTDNSFNFFNVINGEDIRDLDRSNQFEYRENVNAGYVNFSKQIKKWGIQAGVRVEHTHSTGDLTSEKPTDNDFVERDYVDFFPSAGLTYSLNPKNTFQFSYSRRINRPSYQDLNPFEDRLDELTFQQGNPFLQPEYANNFQVSHSFNYRFNTTFSFSHTTDLITRQTEASGDKASYITWLNLDNQYVYSLNFSAPVPLAKWWSSYTSITGTYSQNKAENFSGNTVDLDATSFNIYSQQTFRLPKDVSFELSGWYNAPGLWGGTFEMDQMWSLDAGVQKKVLGGRGNLKVSVSDIFRTNKWHGVSEFGPLFMDVGGRWDSRRLRVNFSYMLGNTQVKGARKRKTGLEDEQRRVKSGN